MMNNLSAQIPFDSTKEHISSATKELAFEIYRACLGRKPTKNDAPRFQQKINTDDKSINDQYFDGKKIGSFVTKYVLDIPRSISIRFNAVR
jgi:hypothetical protein